ncbi:MAG: UDP-N-acetyl-D-mannosamine dehydrogenase [Methanosphaera sp. rholeuAM6]|nr:MAG: UDP-N-acetyl-D-mannosamine dehydrogenase [Methanosphaera sp. rholeuAM6]
MKICVIGQGYIGIPTSALFAKNNCQVTGVDIDKNKVEQINKGQIPIEEPKLQEILEEVINNGSYRARMEPVESDVYIITVPTPFNKEDLSCNLDYVVSACNSIISLVKKDDVIIVESTIAPLSIEKVVKPIFEQEGFTVGKDLYLAHCPERVLPGNMVSELINNNRIVGGVTPECARKAAEVYGIFVKGNIIETEAKVAEMSKCMENTFRDVNIALANELTKICYELDINVLDVIKIANQHPRVNIHSPGPGVGGHCLAIDPYFIYSLVPDEAKIIKLARDTNNSMPLFVANQVKRILSHKDKEVVSVFGLSYKGNSDDDRESPSYEIIRLLENDYEIRIYDPHIPQKSLTFEEAITDSDLIVILADHNEFKHLDYDLLAEKMDEPVIFDTKNVINPENVDSRITLINYGNLKSY